MDPCLSLVDQVLDSAIFVINLKTPTNNYFSAYYFLKVHLHHFSKIKSHKEVTKQ